MLEIGPIQRVRNGRIRIHVSEITDARNHWSTLATRRAYGVRFLQRKGFLRLNRMAGLEAARIAEGAGEIAPLTGPSRG
jgi:hypothetical protein